MWLVWRAATTTAAHFVSVDVRPSLGPHPRPFSMLEKGGATLTRSCCSWSPDQLPLRPRRISLRALRGPAPLVQDTHCINNTPPTIYYPPSTFLPPPKADRLPLTKRPTYSFTHLPAYPLTNLPSNINFPFASSAHFFARFACTCPALVKAPKRTINTPPLSSVYFPNASLNRSTSPHRSTYLLFHRFTGLPSNFTSNYCSSRYCAFSDRNRGRELNVSSSGLLKTMRALTPSCRARSKYS